MCGMIMNIEKSKYQKLYLLALRYLLAKTGDKVFKIQLIYKYFKNRG